MTMFLLIAAGTLPWIFLIDAVWGDDTSNDDHHEENTDPTDPIYPTDEIDPTDVTDETDPTDETDVSDGDDGTDGDDLLWGTDDSDTLYGFAGDDYFYGFSGDDSLFGGDGDDWLNGGDGADWVEGGAGNDTLVATSYGGADTMFGNEGGDIFEINIGSASHTTDPDTGETIWDLSGLQHAEVPVIGDLTPEDSVILASWVYDTPPASIRFEAVEGAEDQVNVIADFQTGTDAITSITLARLDSPQTGYESSFTGRVEKMETYSLSDVTSTGEGTASLAGGDEYDRISLSEVSSEDLDYIVYEWDSSDDPSEWLGTLDIRVEGGGGDDRISLGLGADTALGGEGNDTIDGLDEYYDLVSYPVEVYEIYHADLIDGGAGDDSLIGGDLGEVGQAGDTLIGGEGDDTLVGDNRGMTITMTGGAGEDHFVTAGSVEGPWGALYREVYTPDGDPIEITDFRIGEDVLEVTGVDSITSVSLEQTADGDTVVRVNYTYHFQARSGEMTTETVTWNNGEDLFVLRGVTGATVEDLFGGNPAG